MSLYPKVDPKYRLKVKNRRVDFGVTASTLKKLRFSPIHTDSLSLSSSVVKMSDNLPEDIMVRIFERLPTISLIRFSCLSKRWNLLILSSPVFAKSHFQIASQQQTLTRKFLFKAGFNKEEKPGLECIDMEAAGGNNNSGWVSKNRHTPFINQSDDIIGFCSCNGIVCVLLKNSINKKTRLYIWNPSTGCNKELPCPNVDSEEERFRRSIASFGIGYVSSTDDYKVFVIIEIYDRHLEMRTWESNTLSLRTPNTWKRKQIEPSFDFYPIDRIGTLLHETLHWANNDGAIIAFDLCKEEFRTMPFPPRIGTYWRTMTILGASLGGCLWLMITNHPPTNSSTEFWVMREYDVADSWARQFTLSNLFPSKLVMATETTLYVEITDCVKISQKLIRISGDDENKVQICMVRKKNNLDAIEYQETLLWLP